MGSLITRIITSLSSSKKPIKMLLLGLDNAGKTTILYQLRVRDYAVTYPTVGFNIEIVQYKNFSITIWDVSGQASIRKLWKHYFTGTNALIYVVDASDKERYELAKKELYGLLNEEKLQECPLLVISNKMDIAGKTGVSDVMNNLDLASLRGRNWHIQGVCAITAEGLDEGFEKLVHMLDKPKN